MNRNLQNHTKRRFLFDGAMDEYSLVPIETPYYGILKVWNGTSWIATKIKNRKGSLWGFNPLKRWNGSRWLRISQSSEVSSFFNGTLGINSSTRSYAFSFRRVVAGYTGPVATIRRISDDSEVEFTADDFSDGMVNTFLEGTTGTVTKWFSQDMQGADPIQANTSVQPIISQSASGYWYAYYPGNNHKLTLASDTSWNFTGSVNGTGSIVSVLNFDREAGGWPIGAGGSNPNIQYRVEGPTSMSYYGGQSLAIMYNVGNLIATTSAYVFTKKNLDIAHYTNTVQTHVSTSEAGSIIKFNQFGNHFSTVSSFKGQMPEIILFTSHSLSQEDIDIISANQMDYYGI